MVEVDNFVEEAFSEISDDEKSRILSNSRVLSALKGKSTSVGTIQIGEEVVSFKLSVSKKLRNKMALFKSKASVKEPSMDELNSLMYNLLAALCIDDPWDKWQTWSVYDDTADVGAMEILTSMMRQVRDHIEDVKDFRRRPGRITPVEDLQIPVPPTRERP